MNRTYVNALVLRNDGDTAILKPKEGPEQEVTFRHNKESRQEFHQIFPSQGMVHLFHSEGRLSPEEKKNSIANWINVEALERCVYGAGGVLKTSQW